MGNFAVDDQSSVFIYLFQALELLRGVDGLLAFGTFFGHGGHNTPLHLTSPHFTSPWPTR